MKKAPGLTPRSPVMSDGPVFVISEPARTAKLVAEPSGTAVAIAFARVGVTTTTAEAITTARAVAIQTGVVRCSAGP